MMKNEKILQCSLCICACLRVRAYENACFIQHPYWQADDTQCEDVGCWGDDGCNDEDGYYGVTTVFLHPLWFDDTELGKQPTYHGQLEDYSEDQRHHEQGVHIALQRKHVLHILTYRVGAQEPNG